jgi:hypothetical protein
MVLAACVLPYRLAAAAPVPWRAQTWKILGSEIRVSGSVVNARRSSIVPRPHQRWPAPS